jgi:nucleoside-diphosphate-sugar epimerase
LVAKGRPRSRHGQIALRLAKVLSQRGDEAVALIRNPDQADEVRRVGAEPVVADVELPSEGEVTQAIAGCDAVVFATGAGPGSGPGRRRACPPSRSAMTRAMTTSWVGAATRQPFPQFWPNRTHTRCHREMAVFWRLDSD